MKVSPQQPSCPEGLHDELLLEFPVASAHLRRNQAAYAEFTFVSAFAGEGAQVTAAECDRIRLPNNREAEGGSEEGAPLDFPSHHRGVPKIPFGCLAGITTKLFVATLLPTWRADGS